MNTPTPRTDEFAIIASPSRNQYLDFAEQLERELTAALEEIEMLKNAIANNNDAARAEYIELKEQRDEARKLAERYRNLSCDSQEEADETLLPWENNQPTEL